MHRPLLVAVLVLTGPPPLTKPPAEDAGDYHAAGVAFHLERCLDAAAREYDAALAIDPPRPPTAGERMRMLRLAPRVFVNAREPFRLKNAAAILHPSAPVIAYHLFWDDDVDFPDDNDPSDHEVVWVRYDDRGQFAGLSTLFHGRVLTQPPAAGEPSGGWKERPRVDVQWGKHGPMPAGWADLRIATEEADADTGVDGAREMTLLEYNRLAWRHLSTEGTRRRSHPLAIRHGWPSAFEGSFAAFTSFTHELDVRERLKREEMMLVSQWNSATLARHLLLYNFRPKLEWPD